MFRSAVICILSLVILTACEPRKAYQSQAEEVFPEVPITRAALMRLDKLGVTPEFFRDRWTAVVFANADCDTACQQRLSLLDGLDDVQALLVIQDLATHQQMRAISARYPMLEVSMGATAASIDNFTGQFADEAIPLRDLPGYIYLVNPRGVLVYRLPAERLSPGDVQRELVQLR